MGVENGDINGGRCYINITTGSKSNNHNTIHFTKKRDKISPNRSEMEINELQDGVEIYVILTVSTIHQYANMEYNNKHHKLMTNGKI